MPPQGSPTTPASSPLERHSRGELWEAAFKTFYTAYFQEMVADRLVTLWQRVDDLTKVLVALTASGSAIAGWSLWTQPAGKTAWLVTAGVAAVLSIIHAALGVPAKLKDHIGIKRRFASLRTDIETFRYRMRIDTCFSIADFTAEFASYRKRLGDEVQLLQNDLLLTSGLEGRIQDRLNVILREEIQG